MTYLVPSDWYANHNMAPGDARGPQPRLQPQQGHDEMQLPPMRGTYGHYIRPMPPENVPGARTMSPFAVPDGLYSEGIMSRAAELRAGMGYVGEDPAPLDGKTLQQLLEQTSRELKRQIIETTAAQMATTVAVTVVILTLNVIPVIGWIINVAWAGLQAAFAVSAAHYQREAERIMANLQIELESLGSMYQAKLDAEKIKVFDEESGAAIQLALSGASLEDATPKPVNGLGASWWSKLVSPVYHATEVLKVTAKPYREVVRAAERAGVPGANKVAAEMDRTDALVNKIQSKDQAIYRGASGEEVQNIARRGADDARARAKVEFDRMYQQALASIRSPDYRQHLRVSIARFIRSQPNMAPLLANVQSVQAQNIIANMVNSGAISDQQIQQAQVTAMSSHAEQNAKFLPAIGAMAAVLLIGSMKS